MICVRSHGSVVHYECAEITGEDEIFRLYVNTPQKHRHIGRGSSVFAATAARIDQNRRVTRVNASTTASHHTPTPFEIIPSSRDPKQWSPHRAKRRLTYNRPGGSGAEWIMLLCKRPPADRMQPPDQRPTRQGKRDAPLLIRAQAGKPLA